MDKYLSHWCLTVIPLSRYTWSKEKAGFVDGTWSYSYPKPPLSWLPPLPDDGGSGRRGSSHMGFESPYGYARFGRRSSGFNNDGYTPSASDGTSSRRGSGRWNSEESSPRMSRASSQSFLPSWRRSAEFKSDRPPWRSPSICPNFDSYPNFDPSPYAWSGPLSSFFMSSTPASAGGVTTSWLSTTDETPDRLDSVKTKEPTPTHEVIWKPKRNTVKIFHEKLQWNAVSTIPKPTPLPRHVALAKDPVDVSWTKNLSRRNKPPLPVKPLTKTKEGAPDPEETPKEAERQVSEKERKVLDSLFGAVSSRRMSTYKASPFSSDIFM